MRDWLVIVAWTCWTAASAAAQLYRSPVTCDDCIEAWHYLDHGFTQDWNCGSSTYSGHRGSDFSLRGGNAAIDLGHAVVAMAAGTVIAREDGYHDRCTQCGGPNCGLDFGRGLGNHVVIDHGAYSVMYAHMRKGSIQLKAGDVVTCGQKIGEIGSSGCSTGAHVHIEVHAPGADEATDPFGGSCSPTPASLWVEQGAYRTMPSAACEGERPPSCPAATSPTWTCNAERTERRRCQAGVEVTEPCPYGCAVTATGVDHACMIPPDADGDGSRADVDCSDVNAAIHPGAIDVCGDGIDQDCSGRDKRCTPAGEAAGAGGANAGRGGAATAGRATPLAGASAPEPGRIDGDSGRGGAGPSASTNARQSDAGSAGSQSRTPIRVAPRRAADGGCTASAVGTGGLPNWLVLLLALVRLRAR